MLSLVYIYAEYRQLFRCDLTEAHTRRIRDRQLANYPRLRSAARTAMTTERRYGGLLEDLRRTRRIQDVDAVHAACQRLVDAATVAPLPVRPLRPLFARLRDDLADADPEVVCLTGCRVNTQDTARCVDPESI